MTSPMAQPKPLLAARYLIATLAGVLVLVPFVWMIALSVKGIDTYYQYPPSLLTSNPRWENYTEVLFSYSLMRYLANSIFTTLAVTFLQLLVTSLASFAFAILAFKGRQTLFATFLATMMVPGAVMLIPLFIVVKQLGWVNSYYALIIPFAFGGYGIFMLRQFFLGLPRALFEAARIDGCSYFGMYWRICLPLSGPALATLGSLCFMNFYNELLWPLVVINSDALKTVPVGIAGLTGQETAAPNLIMAGVTLSVVPSIIIFLSLQRFLVRGMSFSSSVKG